ncbi:hypothetical protein A11A3_09500 [Alcanivorax hongdengensis A-11-3]|uniref:DUF3592 domain-containing protein n=1 Tax=Alcanivorax hongdengensis A-11-3 TaxID=1177179 RepID=L0WB35_9GAMM|nr:DUF3592 domain-containing protein [Alcanivorax hongdengensis]EKF74224.1 hypothetical protein A11A3_09500 [Alcanivorax hongdengensis A-11-3]
MDNTETGTGSDKKQKSGWVMNLFAGLFLVAGLALMVFVGLKPLFHYWQSGSWQQVPARVLSSELHRHRGDDSTTYSVTARYRYEFDGRSYTSNRASLYSGSDNFDDYWQQLAGRLERARLRDYAITAWVNPQAPSQAYLDRTLRWSAMVFGVTIGAVFSLVGGGLLWLFNRSSRQRQRDQVAGTLSSQETSGYWILIGMGAIFVLLPSPALWAIPEEWHKGNYAILAVLLFPLVGGGMLLAGWKMRRTFLYFGPTPLEPDPNPGQIGGQMGGEVRIGLPLTEDQIDTLMLSCVRRRQTGSGKNRSTSETIIWQREQRPLVQQGANGTRIQFCFDVPEGLPETGGPHDNRIHWRVNLEGRQQGRSLSRSWELPGLAGTGQSRFTLPEAHRRNSERQASLAAMESANAQIQVEQTGQGLRIYSAAGRHLGMKLGLLLFGGLFTAVGGFLLYQAASEGAMLYFMAVVFGGIGLLILFSALYMLGRSLETHVRGSQVRTVRRWLGIPLFQRQGQLLRADQLQLHSSLSTTQGTRKTEYMALSANLDGRKVRLAEGIAGRDAGEALQQSVLRVLRLA